MVVVAICTMAMVIVLSVFNGLGGMLRSIYSTFDPEIKIEIVKGKSFEATDELMAKIRAIDGVGIVTEVIEDYAYVKYQDASVVATIKGVSDNFLDQNRIQSSIVAGDLKLKDGDLQYAIIGQGIQYALSADPNNDFFPLQIYYIKDTRARSLNTSNLYSKEVILPGSVFAIEKNYDENYIFVPLQFAERLLNYTNKRTSIEIKTSKTANINEVRDELRAALGDSFKVLNNEEQHADLYKLLKLEKFFMFLVIFIILIVGSLNISFSLAMLVMDKRKDISVLYAVGAKNRLIRTIFLLEGLIVAVIGATIGLMLGGLICWLQQEVGIFSLGMETAVMNSYPVEMEVSDFLIIGLSAIFVTLMISYRPSLKATRHRGVEHL